MPKVIIEGHNFIFPIMDVMKLFYKEVSSNNDIIKADFDDITIFSILKDNKVITKWEHSNENFYLESHEALNLPKREVKRQLYKALSSISGVNHHWGSLTGIRPTIIATECLDNPDKLTREYFVSPAKADLAIKTAYKENEILSNLSKDSIHCYIGIPFCRSRCLYCSFISQEYQTAEKWVNLYVEALIKEIRCCMPAIKDKMKTLYIGGGTPTALPDDLFEKILCELSVFTSDKEFFEFTVEAGRADTITRNKLQIMKKYNVNRICINPQTMNDKTLDFIGRKHTSLQVKDAFALARELSFPIINMDLIAGLPGENFQDFKKSLDEVILMSPDNITVHSLSLKRTSELARITRYDKFDNKDLTLKNIDFTTLTMQNSQITDMIEYSNKKLEENRFIPYYLYRQKDIVGGHENVGYTLPGKECVYNIAMMSDQFSVMALGAGSISKYLIPGDPSNNLQRLANLKDLREYLSRIDETIAKKMKLFGRK